MSDEQKEHEKILTVNGKELNPELMEERKAQLANARAELDAKLERGEINGVEYNQKLIELVGPTEYVAKHRLSMKQKIAILSCLVAILSAIAIPTAIQLNWRYYFQNTLTISDMPDYSHIFVATPDADPIQELADNIKEMGEYKGRQIIASYRFFYSISGVVTSVHDYWGFDDYDTLVPRDVCIAWGSLKDLYLTGEAEFHQYDRHCYGRIIDSEMLDPAEVFTFKTPFGQTRTSISSVSNNHLIASTAEIRDQILNLKAGDEVRINGYLVDVTYGSLVLNSSIDREDIGNGACEVIYVTGVDFN